MTSKDGDNGFYMSKVDPKNIIHPIDFKELPKDIQEVILKKYDATIHVALKTFTKDQHHQMVQFKEFNLETSSSSYDDASKAKVKEVKDSPLSHDTYSMMLLDQKIILDNSMLDAVAMTMEHDNKLERKSVEPLVSTINGCSANKMWNVDWLLWKSTHIYIF